MPRVSIEPGGLTIDVDPGETLAESAWRQGYRWPTTCWGEAECMVCVLVVTGGEESAVPAADDELDAMRLRLAPQLQRPGARLACRLRVARDGLVVEKVGVRPPQGAQSGDDTPGP